MFVGMRVIKTVIAVGLSIAAARALRLDPPHFAGIVSMLAVQPSLYRSFAQAMSHMASALFAALFGIGMALLFGNSSLTIALSVLLVMALHIGLGRTISLQLAVIVGINTMGTATQLHGYAASHQILLVLIGMTVGTAVNAVHRPVHQERQEGLLTKSESMLRTLLHFIQLDLEAGRVTPYKPIMKRQIEDIRAYIEQGHAVSGLIREDRRFTRSEEPETGSIFRSYETMIERIRDLSKALQRVDIRHAEAVRLARAIGLVLQAQERIASGRTIRPGRICAVLRPVLQETAGDPESLRALFPYYQAYEALADYTRELHAAQPSLVQLDVAFARPLPVRPAGRWTGSPFSSASVKRN
ncbi:hypothetical protein J31TS4_02190 [Paenibacillus sp. J31TS4]|uniref:FUSC family protein n=1 Tax=Paenibacillus sp. J31TS4 TaxID=2807195 RepID=UPI001B202384|nr:aromatic acid exporter family protein [Paenibacillus sp. J31TS4]GIP36939.1 hypothetical protein J31TS4_02190 [Paenibacillus sp. J31TS4]